MRSLVVVSVAYLLGSIPFGYLIVRAKEGGDIRQTGSGGTGATNVSRRAGKGAGVLTLVLDALKGAAAVILAKVLFSSVEPPNANADWWVAATAIAAIVGHMFPVWLGFRGGKGVATGVGVFFVLAPLSVLGAGVVFLIIVALTRYVSLGSIIAAACVPLFVWLQDVLVQPTEDMLSYLTAATVAATLIVFAHRENIGRLLSGSESKFR